PPHVPHILALLGKGPRFKSFNIPEKHTHMDWYESNRVQIQVLSTLSSSNSRKSKNAKSAVDVTCTLAQYYGSRSLFDSFKSLAVITMRWPVTRHWPVDDCTSYRTVVNGYNEDEVPICPTFKEIGKCFGE
ncbi:hypothetical protein BDQ12DRAFT_612124, partial [Crucibulum laeve]